ncbi:M20/M25/M40 family metallo-hydrolase [Streptomyces sp. NPDC047082]|uniref:M20/M25/M40 family metallo-hydrolase n=1 Tax=Streptomyces sp. NPDC047082 TaxID=3155259 RepID=UPI0033C80557
MPGEHGALFDVALHIGVRRGEAHVGRAVEAGAGEFAAEGVAVAVGQGMGVLQGQSAGGNGAAEHVGAEADALLLGEDSDLDGAAGADTPLVQGPYDLDAAQDAETAVEGTGGGHAVDVRARQDGGRVGVGAFAAAVDVAHPVDADGQSRLLHPSNDLELTAVLDQLVTTVPDFQYRLTRGLYREPFEADPRHPVVRTLARHAEKSLGHPPVARAEPFWTDCAILARAGIPCLLFGVDGAGAHAATEYVDLASLERLTGILADTIAEFCS